MATDLARSVLRRYPALRSTWPVERARAWREQRNWREHPRQMASWYRDTHDMRTRVCISNLEVPEAAECVQEDEPPDDAARRGRLEPGSQALHARSQRVVDG